MPLTPRHAFPHRTAFLRPLIGVTLLLAASAPRAPAAPPLIPGQDALVHAELVANVASIQPSSTFRIGVHLAMKDGWHVNWTNPGDAGLAPSVGWKLPAGFKAGVLQWPLPSRIVTGPLVIFGYTGDVLLMADVQVPSGLATGGNVALVADVSWLSCAEECIPGSATVRLELPVEASARSNPSTDALFGGTQARLPGHANEWKVDARIDESRSLVLDIQSGGTTSGTLADLNFFPYEPGYIENAVPQTLTVHNGPAGATEYELRITLARMPVGQLDRVYGLLAASSGLSVGGGPAAIEVNVPVTR